MADQKIDGLAAIGSIDSTNDMFVIGDYDDSSEAKRATPAQVLSGIGAAREFDPSIGDHEYSGHYFTATAGENLTIGQPCCMGSDGKYWRADADSIDTMPAVVMSTTTINADQTGVFLAKGFFRDDNGWGVIGKGDYLYVSTVIGAITHTKPAYNKQVQIVGYGYSESPRIIFFNPSNITPPSAELILVPSVSNESYSGLTIEGTAGETVSMGDICYLKSADGKYWKTDANSSSTMPALVMAVDDISADASGTFLKYGYFRDDSIWGSLTVGALLYASTSPGGITHTAPTGAGDQVQVVGYAYSATNHIVFFNPNYMLVEVPA